MLRRMYILYGGDYTRAPLVQWVLDEGRIPYELRKVDIVNGEHRSAAFLAINPAGLVPVLITPEGDTLHETAALMLYLAGRHELTGLGPRPGDPDWGNFLAAVFHVAADIQSEMKRFHFPHRFSLREADNLAIQDSARALVMSRLAVIDARLARRGPHLLGDRFSLADFYLCFWIAYLDHEAACAAFPAIATLYRLVHARPTASRWLADTERMAADYAAMMRRKPAGVIA
jgi:glutathione S-transferase